MTGKSREVADTMERRKIDLACVQKTKWKGAKAREIGGGFKLFYNGGNNKRNGVGIIVKKEWQDNILKVNLNWRGSVLSTYTFNMWNVSMYSIFA